MKRFALIVLAVLAFNAPAFASSHELTSAISAKKGSGKKSSKKPSSSGGSKKSWGNW